MGNREVVESKSFKKNIICPKCKGRGKRLNNANVQCEQNIEKCAFCDGTGIVVSEVNVNILKGRYNG